MKDNKWSRESSAFLDPYASLLPLVLYDEQDNPMVMGYDAYDVFDTVGKGTKKRKERGRGGNGAEWTNAPNEILMLGLIFEVRGERGKGGEGARRTCLGIYSYPWCVIHPHIQSCYVILPYTSAHRSCHSFVPVIQRQASLSVTGRSLSWKRLKGNLTCG